MNKCFFVCLSLVAPVPLVAQLPLETSPVCVRLTYDSLEAGIALTDLPTRLELGPGRSTGDVRSLDTGVVDARLKRGQGWSVSQNRDSSYTYMIILGVKNVALNYLLTPRGDSITGYLAALYLERAARQAHQRRAHVFASLETCSLHRRS